MHSERGGVENADKGRDRTQHHHAAARNIQVHTRGDHAGINFQRFALQGEDGASAIDHARSGEISHGKRTVTFQYGTAGKGQLLLKVVRGTGIHR